MEYRYNLAFHTDSLELAGELNVHAFIIRYVIIHGSDKSRIPI